MGRVGLRPAWGPQRNLHLTSRILSAEEVQVTEEDDYHSIIKDTERGKGQSLFTKCPLLQFL